MYTYAAYIMLNDGTMRDETTWATSEQQAYNDIADLYANVDYVSIAISMVEEAAE